jgi:transcription elongation factor GreA
MAETTHAGWLTQEAFDRLQAEYEHLTGAGRTEITGKIATARDEGDLKENGGYHAAREEQAKSEARIRELKAKLENAVIGQPQDNGVVEPGMVVTALLAGEEMVFLLGSREVAGGTDIDVYSEKSPLGSAINGRVVGDTVNYVAPNGNEIKVQILAATPFQG